MEIKCKYCNKELPEIIDSGSEICKCKKSQIDWSLSLTIQNLNKQLSQVNKELSNLREDATT